MTTLLVGMNLTNENGKKCDDLTRIRGIGQVKQQWLRESLKIYTFQDLARLSIAQIESTLKAEWQTVSRREIKGWIAQAQKLAANELSLQPLVEFPDADIEELGALPTQEEQFCEFAVESVSTETEAPCPLQTQEIQASQQVVESVITETEASYTFATQEAQSCELVVESANTEAQENRLPFAGKDEWRSFASFKVEFQLRQIERLVKEQRIIVQYLEADKCQAWSSLENDRLQQWMLDQIIERMQDLSEAESPVGASPVVLEIDHIQAFQSSQTYRSMVAKPGNRLFAGSISSEQPFALKITFSLAGLNAANLTKKPIAYFAQFYVRNRITEIVTHLGDAESGTLLEGQLSYTAMLPETFLQPGVYRLEAIVKLQGVSAAPASFKIPLLQVV
jgi:hypothetical protein